MKTKKIIPISTAVVLLAVFSFAFVTPEFSNSNEVLPIGAKAPLLDDPVKDVSGKILTMGEVAMENGLLVIFSCNTCPWVAAWEDRYNPIANLAREKGIGVIFLNPNTGSRDQGDSFTDMQQRAKKSGYSFYYAIDKKSKIATAFGANRTPQAFLFNADLKLVYQGAIDDNAREADNVKKPYLKNAIRNLVSDSEISPQTMDSFGCGIKWPE